MANRFYQPCFATIFECWTSRVFEFWMRGKIDALAQDLRNIIEARAISNLVAKAQDPASYA
eukprot:UN11208